MYTGSTMESVYATVQLAHSQFAGSMQSIFAATLAEWDHLWTLTIM